jgi:hypothetical protein
MKNVNMLFRGGVGVVWLAKAVADGKLVAVKQFVKNKKGGVDSSAQVELTMNKII